MKIDKYRQIDAQHLRSEQEILDSWSVQSDKPVVSVSCTTYNHENYIEDAIIGFLRQETFLMKF